MGTQMMESLSFWSRILGPLLLSIIIAVFGFVLRQDFMSQQELQNRFYEQIRDLAIKIEQHIADAEYHVGRSERRLLDRLLDNGGSTQ